MMFLEFGNDLFRKGSIVVGFVDSIIICEYVFY